MTANINTFELPPGFVGIPEESPHPNCKRDHTQLERRAALHAITAYVAGKSRSDIGRLRDEKLTEVRMLEARIAERRRVPDGDNFPAKRDARRILEIQKEIDFLTEVFDRPVT